MTPEWKPSNQLFLNFYYVEILKPPLDVNYVNFAMEECPKSITKGYKRDWKCNSVIKHTLSLHKPWVQSPAP